MFCAVLTLVHAMSARARAPLRHRGEMALGRAHARRAHALRATPLLNGAVDGRAPDGSPDAQLDAPLGGELHGLFVAYKPQNWSSFQVVNCIKHTLNRHHEIPRPPGGRRRGHKVGHGGTLDPLATGLLVIGVGRGCRELQNYLKGPKAYRARMTFGIETDTQDSTGAVIRSADAAHVTLEAIRAQLPALTGEIVQRPPAFSAISINGTRSYALARAGELTEADMQPRAVHVHELRVTALERRSGADGTERLEAELYVECGGGTYIRSLIVDLARALGTAAHMSALERTKQGPFELDGGVRALAEEDFRSASAIVCALSLASAHLAAQKPPQLPVDALPVDGPVADAPAFAPAPAGQRQTASELPPGLRADGEQERREASAA
ncbi:hypothetical protein KFE25_013367 [Diacronema lutheri]|uniref:tRNA pseudouridine(55) synthase n=2 Tax=Diacronema lutheri TaxID=2081491 RepID=A0A8J5XQA8_DIALT|nr:hypothetical protein KFE25_013367 [Diacronema lutheri]